VFQVSRLQKKATSTVSIEIHKGVIFDGLRKYYCSQCILMSGERIVFSVKIWRNLECIWQQTKKRYSIANFQLNSTRKNLDVFNFLHNVLKQLFSTSRRTANRKFFRLTIVLKPCLNIKSRLRTSFVKFEIKICVMKCL
jgi:hypothetical protein